MAKIHTNNRVFHVINCFDLGGSEKVALNIAASKHNGFEYHLVEVVKGRGPFSKEFLREIEASGIPYHRSFISNRKLAILLFPIRFLFLAIRYRPAIVHSHAEKPNVSVFLFYILFGWMFRIQYVRTLHNTVHWDEWERIGRIVEPFFLKNHSNISISQAVADSYRVLFGDPGPIIYNGIKEVPQIPFDQLDKSTINILFAGRLESQKGVDILIQVIKECQFIEGLNFWIVGEGHYQKEIKDSMVGLENVHTQDKIYGLSSYLASFDYLFMPSRFEGLALLSIEASFAKTPTIINDCPGLNETLPKDWPLKVQDNCIGQYVELFERLASFDRNELGERAYHFVKEKLSIKEMQRNYEEIYTRLLNKRHRHAG